MFHIEENSILTNKLLNTKNKNKQGDTHVFQKNDKKSKKP